MLQPTVSFSLAVFVFRIPKLSNVQALPNGLHLRHPRDVSAPRSSISLVHGALLRAFRGSRATSKSNLK
jgi:hypothetical protein